MKKTFYIYWIAYLILMAVNLSGLTAPLWFAIAYEGIMSLTWIGLALSPMAIIYIYEERLSKIDLKYLEAIIVSFSIRSVLFLFSLYGMDNRWYILMFFGLFMLAYYLFEVRFKLRKIEDKYFKY